jgi:hypothetical protein
MTSLDSLKLYYSSELKRHQFGDQTKFRCDSCKGTGSQIIETTKTKIKQSISCFPCEGKGYHTFNEILQILVSKNCWCECEDFYELILLKDDEHEGCLTKSHYHCKICGLLKK